MDAIVSEVGRSTGMPVIRSSVPLSSGGSPSGSAVQGSNPVTTMFEHILASLARFETRMDDFDRRLVPPRIETTRSLGLPSHWFTDSLPQSMPIPVPTQSVVTSIPQQPRRAWEQPWSVPGMSRGEGTLGPAPPPLSMTGQFGGLGTGPHTGSGPITSWEPPGMAQGMALPSNRQPTSWDNPAWHNNGGQWSWEQPRDVKMKPPRFNGTDAVNWIARVQYYFDHLMMPEAYRLHYVVMFLIAKQQNGCLIIARVIRWCCGMIFWMMCGVVSIHRALRIIWV